MDEQWLVQIDVDNNLNTGQPGSGGDVLLVTETTPQSSPCSPLPNQQIQQNLIAAVFVWNSSQQQFVASGAIANVVADTAASTLTISTDIAGALGGLSSQSPMQVATFASYTPTGSTPSTAYDNASPITPGGSATDGPQDVQACSAPCSQTASWIQMIDLVNIAAGTSVPLPAFGGNTVYVEFDVANLPSTLGLCRYPTLFALNSGNDSIWLAAFNLDGNANTGFSGYNGAEATVNVFTTLQTPMCTTNTVATTQALYADLEHYDSMTNTFVKDADLPVYADSATGKIVVQADRTSATLSSLSSTSSVVEIAGGYYPPGTYTADSGGPFGFGHGFSGSSDNVQYCNTPCSPTVNWYSQIDLIGGSVQLPDNIFRSGFE